ncbi:MAG: EamA family transporter [Peptococcaceae bacterium]|nr:EamA family transporter [Peptococcaceae bacterium]
MNQTSKSTSLFSNPLLQLSLSMFIFGTIGIFVRHIPFPSSVIALARGGIGMLFLLLVVLVSRKKISKTDIRRNLIPLCLSGFFLGFNWILLFEAYRYTTVATATLCYYLAPVIVILVSPVILKEKLTAKKLICVAVALLGMVFVSGILETGLPTVGESKGILFGIAAAAFYASVVLCNKHIHDISSYDMTIMQLGIATVVLLPYTLLTESIGDLQFTASALGMLLFVAIVHTGVAYALYFSSMQGLSSHTIAIFSYVDPIVAIILSAILLHEPMGIFGVIGAVLILGSTLISGLPDKNETA